MHDTDALPEPNRTDAELGGDAGETPGETADGIGGGTESSDGATDEAARQAFADVIEFYHRQLDREIGDHTEVGDHPDRPTTAREYFREVRGWADETIADRRLGWAPPDAKDELIAWLYDRGHDREEILATGLIGESDTGGLYTLWNGRYVLPYFNADGGVAYAIARCTGGNGGGGRGDGGHPADYQAGKYAKVRHTDKRVPLTEPIYGLDTLDGGAPVVVAEGIADAISAHEAGYSVLSPVAKEFKPEHISPLRAALTAHDVPTVYIVPDAEPASFAVIEDAAAHASIGAGLDMPTVGAGIGGALRTATRLREAFAAAAPSVYVAPLPRPSAEKIDLDDYLHEWADGLGPVLRSAKPPEAFSEFELATRHMASAGTGTDTDAGNATSAARTGDFAGAGEMGPDTDRIRSVDPADPRRSCLLALDMADVTPPGFSEAGDRGHNPARHTGDSRNYFVLREGRDGDLVATDYKAHGRKATYNALTYLLVDAGERDRDDPEGSLSDREMFAAWRHARETGILPLMDEDDNPLPDPIPHRALRWVALDGNLCEPGDIEDGWRLPPDAYAGALDRVREKYDLDPERPVDSGHGDGEVTAGLPVTKLDAVSSHERGRAARKRGLDWPTTDEVGDRVADGIRATFAAEGYRVVQAPTASNKTGTAVTTPWRDVDDCVTGSQPVVMFTGTCDARDEAAERAREAGLSVHVLQGREELCAMAAGTYDPGGEAVDAGDPDEPDPITIDGQALSAWIAEQCEKNIPCSQVHIRAVEHLKRQGSHRVVRAIRFVRANSNGRAGSVTRRQFGAPTPGRQAILSGTVVNATSRLPRGRIW